MKRLKGKTVEGNVDTLFDPLKGFHLYEQRITLVAREVWVRLGEELLCRKDFISFLLQCVK
jgi:hypothetical protein